ncbi:hypothetical protein [Enterobacter hormaechei]|uniref:hypothetical protein n=1 Tax=Enterobacter hormaechei TaxID=158836 RepID=UPI0022390BEC|nr:hypothetical protein [Enterobacter hormaechei]MCW4840017.1 hypothetical protein [Enterobacter hormaechei subsp. xiangfangensis]
MKPSYEELEQKIVESQREFRAADATIENLQMKLEKLAAENAGLKDINAWCKTDAFKNMYREFKAAEALGCHDVDCMHDAMMTALMHAPETPATDAFLAEVRAQARNEGINYAASRLAAAFNHGFVDKPLAEVFDVVHMIMDTKEELANSTLPAADGLSGEYAEKFLTEFAGYARKGVQS